MSSSSSSQKPPRPPQHESVPHHHQPPFPQLSGSVLLPPPAPRKCQKRKSASSSSSHGDEDDDGDLDLTKRSESGSPVKKNRPKKKQHPFVFGGAELNQQKDLFLRNLSAYSPTLANVPPSPPHNPPSIPPEETKEQEASFDSLLQTFASMEFPDSGREECPICMTKVSVVKFAIHVYKCADRLDAEDMETQEKRSENVALGLITGKDVTSDWVNPNGAPTYMQNNRRDHGVYEADFQTECPVCKEKLVLGTAINQHINECLDKTMSDEPALPVTNGSSHGSNSKFDNFRDSSRMTDENEKEGDENQEDIMDDSNQAQPLLSSRQQLAACAKMLVKEEKGSDKYNDLLESFSQLGLTKENLQNSLQG